MKYQEYFKWLFSRWYLYLIAIFLMVNSLLGEDIGEVIRNEQGYFTGIIIGSIIWSALLISLIFGLIKLIKIFRK